MDSSAEKGPARACEGWAGRREAGRRRRGGRRRAAAAEAEAPRRRSPPRPTPRGARRSRAARASAHRDGEYAAQKALQIERFAAVLQSTREALDAQAAEPAAALAARQVLRNSPRGKAPPPPPDILDEPSRGCAQAGPASPRIPPVPFEQQKGFFVGDKVKLFSSPEWSPRDCGTTPPSGSARRARGGGGGGGGGRRRAASRRSATRRR